MSYEAWGDDEPDNYDHLYDAGWWDSDQVEAAKHAIEVIKHAIEAILRTPVYEDGKAEKGISVQFIARIHLLASEVGLMDRADPLVIEASAILSAAEEASNV